MRRLGRFKISNDLRRGIVDGEITGLNIFKDMFILAVEEDIMGIYAEYKGYHPDFDTIEIGETIPEYIGIFDSKSIHPRWERV